MTGVLLGCAVQVQSAALLPAAATASMALAGVLSCTVAWLLARQGRGGTLDALLVLIAAGLLSHSLATWRAQWRLGEALAPPLEGVDLVIEGMITSLPTVRSDGTRFVFEVDTAWRDDTELAIGPAGTVPRRLMLGWYSGFQDAAPASWPPSELGPGQRWRWTVRLRSPHGHANPHGFDLELWLFEQGIRASGSVRPLAAQRPQRLGEGVGAPVERLRMAVRSAIQQRLGNAPAAGVLSGLAVGDQSAIDRDDWAVFRSTGVAHLLAVSGLHITLFAALAMRAISAAWRRSPRLALWWPTPLAARWGGLAAATAYAVLAGWGVPAQRTVYMLAVLTALRGAGRQWPLGPVLLACATVVVMIDPWALLQPGFWLSFVAVALLAMAEPGRDIARDLEGDPARAVPSDPSAHPCGPSGRDADAAPSRWRRAHRTLSVAARTGAHSQWVASVGLAPWTVLFFNQVSLVGLLANAVAIPVITLLVTPLALLGMVLPDCWRLGGELVEWLMAFLRWLSTWPAASLHLPASAAWAQVLGVAGAAWLVAPWPMRVRLLGLGMALPMLWPLADRPPDGEFDLVGVDVGQGNAVLVRTARHVLLYDAGPVYGRHSDAGERVLVPLLRALGAGPLDLLVLSHRDADHTGGAVAVLDEIAARRVTSSLEAGHALRRREPHQPCEAGQRWRWDGVDFQVLHPTRADLGRVASGALRPNGVSCVLRVGNGRRTLLLLGDVEREQELALLDRHDVGAGALKSDVMLVPHHGSRTSSTQNLLNAVDPQWALVQAGHRNRYGHPAPDVMARYGMHGIGIVRTDSCGAWHWRSADALQWCHRTSHPRYWHAPIQGDGSAESVGPRP